ncbi:MAG: guanylate kinase [Acidobacteria bacterium]|nr:guanylate kinase [Acidobacteriota bacterium]
MARNTILFVLSGPSGSGKTTIVHHLLARFTDMIFSVSYTTRAPRPSEKDGREYHFVNRADFEAMIGRGEFLEHACVFDDYYGTHRRYLERAQQEGKDLILDIDVQGATQVRSHQPGAVFIFVLPPSCEELKQRLRARGDAQAAIDRRLEFARHEIRQIDEYEYVIINADREQACAEIEAVAQRERCVHGKEKVPAGTEERAARCRRMAQRERVSGILKSFEVTPA